MENKKNKLKIFKRIGAIVCAFALTIVAFMLPYSTKFNAKNMIASADEVTTSYTFNASDLYNFQIRVDGWVNQSAINVLFSANFVHESGTNYVSIYPNFHKATAIDDLISYVPFLVFDPDNQITFYNLPLDGSVKILGFGESVSSYNGGTRVYVKFKASENFNANVYSVNLRLSNTNLAGSVSSTEKYLILTYYDENNNTLQIEFTCPRNYIFAERTYFLTNSFDDNQFYNNGYNAGYNAGSADGETKGYTAGYNAGEVIGYNNGYSAGVEAANNYSFFSLISAVIDAPIQAFMGLFNYELLGINLAGFFTGLLTLAFIITIVRLVMP